MFKWSKKNNPEDLPKLPEKELQEENKMTFSPKNTKEE